MVINKNQSGIQWCPKPSSTVNLCTPCRLHTQSSVQNQLRVAGQAWHGPGSPSPAQWCRTLPVPGPSGRCLIGGSAPAQLHPTGTAAFVLPSCKRHQPSGLITHSHSVQRTSSSQNLMKNSENQQQGCTAWHLLLPAYLKNKCCHSQPEEASIPADSRRPRQLPRERQVLPCLMNHQPKCWQ